MLLNALEMDTPLRKMTLQGKYGFVFNYGKIWFPFNYICSSRELICILKKQILNPN